MACRPFSFIPAAPCKPERMNPLSRGGKRPPASRCRESRLPLLTRRLFSKFRLLALRSQSITNAAGRNVSYTPIIARPTAPRNPFCIKSLLNFPPPTRKYLPDMQLKRYFFCRAKVPRFSPRKSHRTNADSGQCKPCARDVLLPSPACGGRVWGEAGAAEEERR